MASSIDPFSNKKKKGFTFNAFIPTYTQKSSAPETWTNEIVDNGSEIRNYSGMTYSGNLVQNNMANTIGTQPGSWANALAIKKRLVPETSPEFAEGQVRIEEERAISGDISYYGVSGSAGPTPTGGLYAAVGGGGASGAVTTTAAQQNILNTAYNGQLAQQYEQHISDQQATIREVSRDIDNLKRVHVAHGSDVNDLTSEVEYDYQTMTYKIAVKDNKTGQINYTSKHML